jgi:class 3 adenylate cyclase
MMAACRALPRGSRDLLFTDIEGSTRLLHELGDGYGEALDDHRRTVRAACAAHDGVEVDTQGDAFFVAFARASDAAAAAVDAQRGLADAPLRDGMGHHTGEPEV